MQIALTIDVETDWGGRLEPVPGNCQGILKGLPKILSLLDKHDIKATFFVSGNVAKQFRDIIVEIKNKGNEIASHGYDHTDYSKLSANEIEYQLKKSKEVLENIIDEKVFGFRVPQCRQSEFLYSSLEKAGYQYDSSIIGGAKLKGRYDFSSYPDTPFMKDGILEIPISTIPVLRLPFGLLWVNVITFPVFKLLSRFNKRETIVFYFHPFDILREKSKSEFGITIKTWYSLRSGKVINTFEKLLQFLGGNQETKFSTIEELIDEQKLIGAKV